jgi:hypothetical protein
MIKVPSLMRKIALVACYLMDVDVEGCHVTSLLQAKGAKRQYMEVARSLKLYGYLVFRPAICDYPEPHTRATLALGRAALNMRLYTPSGEIKEIVFKVLFFDPTIFTFNC